MAQQVHGLGTLRFPDDPWGRLPWLTAVAVVLTSASLAGFLRLIEEPLTAVPLPPPVRLEVMEVVAASSVTTRVAPPPLPASPRRAEPSRPPQDSPRAAPAREASPEAPPAAPLPLTPEPPVETVGPPLARPAPPPPAPSAPSASRSEPATAPGPAREGGGRMGARALYQPLPELPDSLRRRSIEAVAVARFQVAEDGSAQVQLVEPTSDPDLNRALLDTLRRWRFFPAMQDGKPVASSVDIRIPVSVK